jgi:hypothetical protein
VPSVGAGGVRGPPMPMYGPSGALGADKGSTALGVTKVSMSVSIAIKLLLCVHPAYVRAGVQVLRLYVPAVTGEPPAALHILVHQGLASANLPQLWWGMNVSMHREMCISACAKLQPISVRGSAAAVVHRATGANECSSRARK